MSIIILKIIRGDTASIPVTITDLNDDPVNLTGSSVFFTVKRKKSDDDEDALISKKIIAHSEPLLGKTIVELSADDTDIIAGNYYYDLQVVSGEDVLSTQPEIIKVIQDITTRVS